MTLDPHAHGTVGSVTTLAGRFHRLGSNADGPDDDGAIVEEKGSPPPVAGMWAATAAPAATATPDEMALRIVALEAEVALMNAELARFRAIVRKVMGEKNIPSSHISCTLAS